MEAPSKWKTMLIANCSNIWYTTMYCIHYNQKLSHGCKKVMNKVGQCTTSGTLEDVNVPGRSPGIYSSPAPKNAV